MKTQTKDILIKARDLISKPENWRQGIWFDTCASEAKKGCYNNMCSEGALILAANFDTRKPIDTLGAYKVLESAMGGPPAQFNDTHTHAEVLEAFDKAIVACEE